MMMKLLTVPMFLLALAACAPGEESCKNAAEIDELTGQIVLNGGGRCKALPFAVRPEAVEMKAIYQEPDATECDVLEVVDVYLVEGLDEDWDFGPEDPPSQGEVELDETADLEVGTRMQVNFWSGVAFSENRATIETWTRVFEWGVEDSLTEPTCFFSG